MMTFPTVWKSKSHVPNHQPDKVTIPFPMANVANLAPQKIFVDVLCAVPVSNNLPFKKSAGNPTNK